MLHKDLVEKLNKQINLEFYSSNLYLQMSAWCERNGYQGSSQFLRVHAAEELTHMQRLFDYVLETGALAVLGSIEAPPIKYASIKDIFWQAFEHEQTITAAINQLAHIAFTTQDYATFNFLQWYIEEQREEEALFNSILDKFKLIGTDGNGLFLIDREIGTLANNPADANLDQSN